VIASGRAFADARNLLGLALAMVGKREEALAEFDLALSLNPRYVEAHLNRALTLNELGRYDEAAAAFQSAQELGRVDHTGFSAPVASRLANMQADLAEAYLEAGGVDEAITLYEGAVDLRPEFLDLRFRLGRVCLDNGSFERARREFQSIVERQPKFPGARAMLGMACYLTKDIPAARSAWEACQRENPDDPRIRAYLSLLSRVGG
jgi:tetratricopeptide (TPR) repeat protein